MPTHVHVLVEQTQGWPLEIIVQGWKSVTARHANRVLGRTGPFWAREYFDRAMRDERQLETTWNYILANPVKARLCAAAEDWPWSSAARSGTTPARAPISAKIRSRRGRGRGCVVVGLVRGGGWGGRRFAECPVVD